MNDIFVDIFGDKLSEEKFLFRLWCKIIGLRCKIMRILVCHQMQIMLLDVFNNLGSLNSISVF